ncbi:MAG: CPBP family intramembrane metalloprotease [Clostridiales bacterium]|nr:CPBP family intramembrane metalloprotease [Clostridiales bacterium]
MKKVFIQILKALGYFAVYFTAQNLVMMIAGFLVSMKYGAQIKETAASYEEYMAQAQQYINSYTGICLIVSAILVLLTYFIIEKVKKTSIIKETDVKKVSGKHIGLTVIAAVGGMFFLNFMLSILPIPSDLMGDLTSGMSKLSSYPLWQALLANALLVPVMEEVVFRGYLFSRLSKAMPEIAAALITSAIFGICHGGIVWAAWAFVFGMIICVFRMKTGSIIPGIIFHIIMNTFATLTSYIPVFDSMTKTVMIVLTIAGGILLAGSLAVTIAGKKTVLAEKNAEVTISSAKI